jgi:hypothetical protein
VADVAGLYRRFGVRLPELEDGWASTRCFAGRHRDRHPSARVHLRSGGFRCFACNTRGGVLDALQLLGVHDRGEARRIAVEYGILDGALARSAPRPAPLGVRPLAEPAAAAPAGESGPVGLGGRVDYDALPAASAVVRDRSWVYVDESNVPVGRVRRLDLADGEKRIWQERPAAEGWATGLAGKHLPLYRLPRVLEHAHAGRRVLVVEGEKAVDALDRLGFFATTNAGGAGNWRDEHTAALEGATVLAIADCDLTGRKHAIQVSAQLLGAGVRVLSPLDPEPLRNDGYDIVDHLADVAATIRAVAPELDDAPVRARLHDDLQPLLSNQVLADAGELQRRLEYASYTADPARHAYIDCTRCGRRRVHRLTHGLAYCPCGEHQPAPA